MFFLKFLSVYLRKNNKKARHPVGLFRIWRLGMTPVVPHNPRSGLCYFCWLEHPVLYGFIIGNNARGHTPESM